MEKLPSVQSIVRTSNVAQRHRSEKKKDPENIQYGHWKLQSRRLLYMQKDKGKGGISDFERIVLRLRST